MSTATDKIGLWDTVAVASRGGQTGVLIHIHWWRESMHGESTWCHEPGHGKGALNEHWLGDFDVEFRDAKGYLVEVATLKRDDVSLAWTCQACGQLCGTTESRLAKLYTVDLSAEMELPPGTVVQTVRYCADDPRCEARAKNLRLVGPTRLHGVPHG